MSQRLKNSVFFIGHDTTRCSRNQFVGNDSSPPQSFFYELFGTESEIVTFGGGSAISHRIIDRMFGSYRIRYISRHITSPDESSKTCMPAFNALSEVMFLLFAFCFFFLKKKREIYICSAGRNTTTQTYVNLISKHISHA